MSIRPVSDLRNYPSVLEEVKYKKPVSLTKNGRGAYVIMEEAEFEEYNVLSAQLELLAKLNKARLSSEYVSENDMFKTIMERYER